MRWRCGGLVLRCVLGDGANLSGTADQDLIGFGPGSAADILARLVGKQMEASLSQPIVVENRPGNSSMIAAETVVRASADGYTLFMATIANTLNPAETKSNFNHEADEPRERDEVHRPHRLPVEHPAKPSQRIGNRGALHQAGGDRDAARR